MCSRHKERVLPQALAVSWFYHFWFKELTLTVAAICFLSTRCSALDAKYLTSGRNTQHQRQHWHWDSVTHSVWFISVLLVIVPSAVPARRTEITWQVYEGAPGRGAAVRDGEGHSVDLRGQIWDIQGQIGVSIWKMECGEWWHKSLFLCSKFHFHNNNDNNNTKYSFYFLNLLGASFSKNNEPKPKWDKKIFLMSHFGLITTNVIKCWNVIVESLMWLLSYFTVSKQKKNSLLKPLESKQGRRWNGGALECVTLSYLPESGCVT